MRGQIPRSSGPISENLNRIFDSCLSLPQTLISSYLYRAKQVLDHAPLPGLDLRVQVHAGDQLDHLSFEVDLLGLERQGDRENCAAFLVLHRVRGHAVDLCRHGASA